MPDQRSLGGACVRESLRTMVFRSDRTGLVRFGRLGFDLVKGGECCRRAVSGRRVATGDGKPEEG